MKKARKQPRRVNMLEPLGVFQDRDLARAVILAVHDRHAIDYEGRNDPSETKMKACMWAVGVAQAVFGLDARECLEPLNAAIECAAALEWSQQGLWQLFKLKISVLQRIDPKLTNLDALNEIYRDFDEVRRDLMETAPAGKRGAA